MSIVPDWFMRVMAEAGFLSYRPPIMDAEPMSKDEITMRCNEAQRIHEAHGSGQSIEHIQLMIRSYGLNWNLDRLMTCDEIFRRTWQAWDMWSEGMIPSHPRGRSRCFFPVKPA